MITYLNIYSVILNILKNLVFIEILLYPLLVQMVGGKSDDWGTTDS